MRIAAVVLAVLSLSLTGCVATPAPAPTPEPSTPSTSAPPAAEPTPSADLEIPACETLVPLADARAAFGEATEFLGELPAAELQSRFPVAEVQAAFSAAEPARSCLWGIPNSDGSFTVGVAWLEDADRAAVEAALLGTGVLAVTMGTVTGYDLEGEGAVSSIAETHLFTGGVWIVVGGTTVSTTGVLAATVLDAMRTANPALGL